MMKKYIPIIFIVLLASYAVFDFLSKEDTVNHTIENAVETVGSGGQGLSENTSDDLAETGLMESSQISAENEFAQDFELLDLKGASVKLSDFKGKIVFLNFWATWCPPCREEMPHMQNFYEQIKGQDIEIVAVNLTNLDDGQQAIERFVQDYKLTFPVLLDEDGSVGMEYEIMTIPTSYVLDTEGRIFQKVIGPMNEQMMKDLVEAIRMYNDHGE